MATIAGWMTIRSVDAGRVKVALADLWHQAPPEERPSGGFAVGVKGIWTTAELVGYEAGSVYEWAERLSRHLETAVVGFLLLEGSWNYLVYSCGTRIGGMLWYPNRLARMEGDVSAVDQCLGVPAGTGQAYVVAIARGGDTLAFPDDAVPASDELGYRGLLGRMGADDAGWERFSPAPR